MGAITRADIGLGASAHLHPAQETMPREQLAALQLARLRDTVRNAYDNVPTHRARLDAAGMAPDDIRALTDVQRLPFTVKADLRDHYPFGLFARPRSELTRLQFEHRRSIWERVQKMRNTPGGEQLFLLQTAPQLGVRTTRPVAGSTVDVNGL